MTVLEYLVKNNKFEIITIIGNNTGFTFTENEQIDDFICYWKVNQVIGNLNNNSLIIFAEV